jgi:hypothetical protein
MHYRRKAKLDYLERRLDDEQLKELSELLAIDLSPPARRGTRE